MSDRHIHKAKRTDNGAWVEGYLLKETNVYDEIVTRIYQTKSKGTFIKLEVDPKTICKCEDLGDEKVWENDIYRWTDPAWGIICTGIVKFGKYEQDGSGGEYSSTECFGWYIQVEKVEPLEFTKKTPEEAEENYPNYMRTFSVLQLLKMEHGYLGNIFDNPELVDNH